MLSVIYAELHIQAIYGECRYAESHYAECHYTECRYVECRSANISGDAHAQSSLHHNQPKRFNQGTLTKGEEGSRYG
jgi:hypothetical protein